MCAAMHHLEAGHVQKILYVLDRRPVQQRLRIFQPELLGEYQKGLPELTVPMNNDSRTRVTNLAQPFQYVANVVEIPGQIGQNYTVKRLSWHVQVLSGH